MNVRKSDDFIADIEHQAEYYAINASWEVATRYLDSVEATCKLLGQHPQLGPVGPFKHPHLRGWRFFVVFRPFRSTSSFMKWNSMPY